MPPYGTMSGMPYSATDYWSNLHTRDDLSAVGQSGLPPAINVWLYRILARNLRGFAPAAMGSFDVVE